MQANSPSFSRKQETSRVKARETHTVECRIHSSNSASRSLVSRSPATAKAAAGGVVPGRARRTRRPPPDRLRPPPERLLGMPSLLGSALPRSGSTMTTASSGLVRPGPPPKAIPGAETAFATPLLEPRPLSVRVAASTARLSPAIQESRATLLLRSRLLAAIIAAIRASRRGPLVQAWLQPTTGHAPSLESEPEAPEAVRHQDRKHPVCPPWPHPWHHDQRGVLGTRVASCRELLSASKPPRSVDDGGQASSQMAHSAHSLQHRLHQPRTSPFTGLPHSVHQRPV